MAGDLLKVPRHSVAAYATADVFGGDSSDLAISGYLFAKKVV